MSDTVSPLSSPVPDVDTVIGKLSLIPGIDIKTGMAAMRGKPDKYLNLLEKFLQHSSHLAAELQAALTSDDQPTAQRHAHSLKGASASLGLENMRAAAARLEAALRENAPPEVTTTLLDTLSTVHHELSAAIGDALGSAEKRPLAAWDASTARDLIARLLALLAEDDMRTGDLVRREKNLLNAVLGEQFNGFERRIDDYDFPGALEQLQQVLTARPELGQE